MVDEVFAVCQGADGVLRKSLRLLRDTEVIARGYTMYTAPCSVHNLVDPRRIRVFWFLNETII